MTAEPPAITLRFVAGTLEVHGLAEHLSLPGFPPLAKWDDRSNCFRLAAVDYAATVMALIRNKLEYIDEARNYASLDSGLHIKRVARSYQTEAVQAWTQARGRGLVVLPTGAGKSYVAHLAIDQVRRSALIVAPTLDLVGQWHQNLGQAFDRSVGIIGGGDYVVEDLTVTTYDSAYLHMQNIGHRFGLVVFDECHHLPSEAYSLAAESCLAPYRLGLTATPERADGREHLFTRLIGPGRYEKPIVDLAGDYLADYHVEQIMVELTPQERDHYDRHRGIYRDFLRSQGISMGAPGGWTDFIIRSAGSEAGRRAMLSYQAQRRMAFAAPSKLTYVEALLHKHRNDRAILFTDRNDAAYEMSRRFLIPVITHQTKISERREILDDFEAGHYHAIATSKVLNEGVDIPAANVGIVLSGSGSVREHVQRLGRILRKQPDKQAVLYELVAAETGEAYTSERRRQHDAYQ